MYVVVKFLELRTMRDKRQTKTDTENGFQWKMEVTSHDSIPQ